MQELVHSLKNELFEIFHDVYNFIWSAGIKSLHATKELLLTIVERSLATAFR